MSPSFAGCKRAGWPKNVACQPSGKMQLVVALVLQRYRLTLVEDRMIDPEPTLTLRPRGGLVMRAERVRRPLRDRVAG